VFFFISGVAIAIAASTRADPAQLTFTRDIAPLIYQHCSVCHRPGSVGPFNLLTYDDVHRHLRQILKVVNSRTMPPWLPEPGFGEFAGDRRLNDQTIASLQRWADQGAVEGDPKDLPKPPRSDPQWELGKPDLILQVPRAYTLGPDGPDVYHNFVLPTGLDSRRFVRAVELHSGNTRVVHHAFLMLDRSGIAKRRSDKAGGVGYDSMSPGEDIGAPDGQNITWQPGKETCFRTPDSPWLLPADADIVLQTHLRRQGKSETLQPEIGLYFTDKPPSGLDFSLLLRSTSIDIPPGDDQYTITSSYTLPIDVDAIGIAAHAHYLGKDLYGYALLPDGRRQQLLRIKKWNFNMQDSYTFKSPAPLPKGTTVHMEFRYDNSERNPMNPSSPPRRVLYGDNSTDEMGELVLQLRVHTAADAQTLRSDYTQNWLWPDAVGRMENLLKHDPDNPPLHVDLAKLLLKANRVKDAAAHLNAAFKLDPKFPQAHYILAHLLAQRRDYAHAAERYRKSLEGDPENFRAQADFALVLALMGNLDQSVEQFQIALKLNPRDSLTHANLAKVYTLQGKPIQAKAQIEEALRLDPDQPVAKEALKAMTESGKQP
jgi:tetratricopeptide (TPR) repeat protein/mono/diheme cytochrome c family protein